MEKIMQDIFKRLINEIFLLKFKPYGWKKQGSNFRYIDASGLGRAEYVMPYFTVGFGLGFNVLHKGGDLKSFYQMLTLKVGVTHNTFVHVGYCLKDFQTPNYLMLGVGFRFNNKYPRLR